MGRCVFCSGASYGPGNTVYGTQYMRNSEKSNFETVSIFLRHLSLSGKKTYMHSDIILERFQTFAAVG